jgi:hypothetical protein
MSESKMTYPKLIVSIRYDQMIKALISILEAKIINHIDHIRGFIDVIKEQYEIKIDLAAPINEAKFYSTTAKHHILTEDSAKNMYQVWNSVPEKHRGGICNMYEACFGKLPNILKT